MSRGRHRRQAGRMPRVVRLAAVAAAAGALALGPSAGPANASTIPRWQAYVWALNNESGHWYCWGGAGPGCYDCSGAIVAGYAHVHFWLPHNTVAMLNSGLLEWVPASQAKAGDLAFFGTGHVEWFTGMWSGGWPWTFGALNYGTTVGMHLSNPWWHVTAFYRVRGAG